MKSGWIATLVAAAVLVSPSLAWGQLATLRAEPSVVAAGQSVTVSGINYSAAAGASSIEIRLDRRDGRLIATFAPATSFSGPVTIPADVAAGQHLLIATQYTSAGTPVRGTPGRTRLTVQPAGRAAAPSRPAAEPAAAVTRADADATTLRVGPNRRLNADASAYRGSDAVSLAVNPANPKHVVATYANYLTQRCEATASFDAGATWTAAVVLQPPAGGSPFEPSCRVGTRAAESMNAGVSFGSGQNVYATAISPRKDSGIEQGASVLVYKSADGGLTWAPGVVAMAGGPGDAVATGPYYQLPSVVADPGAGTGGADAVYVAARDASGSGNSGAGCPCEAVRIAASPDGGTTFGAPVQASPAGLATADAPSLAVGHDHAVSLVWRTRGEEGQLHYARSTDRAKTFAAPVVITNVSSTATAPNSFVTPLPGDGGSFPRLAVDRHTNGNLYVVYNQGGIGPTGRAANGDYFIPPDSRVYFQRSVDGGATWQAPKLLNEHKAPPGTKVVQTRQPSVSVSWSGRVDVVWEDRRHWYMGPGQRPCVHTHLACLEARLGDIYLASSSDGGSTFSEDRRITDHSHNNDVGYDYRYGTYTTFAPKAVALGSQRLLVAWMDSREGSFDTDNQDVYLATVSFAAPEAVPMTGVTAAGTVDRGIALSQVAYPAGPESTLAGPNATRLWTRPVIVNEADAPAALAGSVLARANLGPVLASPQAGLPASVSTEVTRLRPAGVYILGDATKLSPTVEAQLVAAGVPLGQIVRVPGSTPAEMAANIAMNMDRRTAAEKSVDTPAFDAAVIANPNSPAAVSAAGLAAARRLPILYVDQNAVPQATLDAISALDIDRTIIIGGTDQVSAGVATTLKSDTRLGSGDEYAVSRAVAAESVRRGLPSNVVYVADGGNQVATAMLGAVAARRTGVMLLSPAPLQTTADTSATTAGLTRIDRLFLLGPAPAFQEDPFPDETPPPVLGSTDEPSPEPTPAPTPAATPTPTPTPSATPTPTPTPTPTRLAGKLSAKVRPARDLKAPFVFKTTGKLTLPAGVKLTDGCTGRVSVQVKAGTKTISTRRVTLSKRCGYSVTVRFANKRRFGKARKLKLTTRFLGNKVILPGRAPVRFARVR